MKRYKVSNGVLVENPHGGLVEWDDVFEELSLIRIENQETITSAEKAIIELVKEIRELRRELKSTRP